MGFLGSRLLILLQILIGLASLSARADYTPPTFEIGVSLQPQDGGFTQKLSGVRFEPNSEGLTTSAYSLLLRYNQDQNRFFELEHSETRSHINTLNTSVFNVRDSLVSLDQTVVRGFDCKQGDLERHRFCWGLELSKDAVPILQFEDSNTLAMGEVKSLMLGPSATFQFPASYDITVHLKAWTYLGLSAENTDRVKLKSDWKFGTQAGAIRRFDEHHGASFTMDYYIRQAKIETPHSSGPITWNVISSAIVFHATYIFSF